VSEADCNLEIYKNRICLTELTDARDSWLGTNFFELLKGLSTVDTLDKDQR
jgi:hypothetical protein